MTSDEASLAWRRSLASLLPPLAAIAVFASQARRFCKDALYFVDDPFISMRYAANLVEHGELSFNPGQRVEGYSNLLHVLLHALDFRLRGHVPGAATAYDGVAAVTAAFSVLEIGVLALLSRDEPGREQEATAWYYAFVLTVASWPFAFWATAGLETPIEGLLYLGISYLCSRAAFRDGAPWVLGAISVLLAALVLVRFEAVIPACAVAFALGLFFRLGGRTKAALGVVVPVLVFAAAYHVFRIAYFGALLPNTFVAKATGGSLFGRLRAGASYCGSWLALLGGGVGLALLVVAVARLRGDVRNVAMRILPNPVLLAGVTLVTVKVLLVTWGGGDWMPGWRMLLPVTPVALFLMVRILSPSESPGAFRRPNVGASLVFAGLVVVSSRGIGEFFPVHETVQNQAGHFKKVPRGNLLVANVLERGFGGRAEEVAIGEAGIIPFQARHVRFMDLFGLVDADMARQPGYMHHRVHTAHVLERNPAAVLFAHLRDEPPFGPYQYGPELLSSDAFHRRYARVELGPYLDTLGWALFLRRDIDPSSRHLAWAVDALPVPPEVPRLTDD
ncbi:MAG TPA: hypothetical protein VHE30_13940 [Polyangiaceae bacterium]|nr:hypothetical protein [Polyangiaceae bacterium]